MQYHHQAGISTIVVLVIVAIVGLAAGAGYYAVNQTSPVPAGGTQPRATVGTLPTGQATLPQTSLAADPLAPNDNPTAPGTTYTGTRLAGNVAPLLDFTLADFTAAKNSGNLVVLYFYADWCPECREEFPKMQQAFNELTADNVIAFRVNYKDNFTDTDEVALAREHGIAYQHTKVFIKNDQQLLKSPETWEKDRYLQEIATHVQ
ncbi:MAG: redoxin domain-containing protein [Candidatus Andersenbacteria bacterium]